MLVKSCVKPLFTFPAAWHRPVDGDIAKLCGWTEAAVTGTKRPGRSKFIMWDCVLGWDLHPASAARSGVPGQTLDEVLRSRCRALGTTCGTRLRSAGDGSRCRTGNGVWQAAEGQVDLAWDSGKALAAVAMASFRRSAFLEDPRASYQDADGRCGKDWMIAGYEPDTRAHVAEVRRYYEVPAGAPRFSLRRDAALGCAPEITLHKTIPCECTQPATRGHITWRCPIDWPSAPRGMKPPASSWESSTLVPLRRRAPPAVTRQYGQGCAALLKHLRSWVAMRRRQGLNDGVVLALDGGSGLLGPWRIGSWNIVSCAGIGMDEAVEDKGRQALGPLPGVDQSAPGAETWATSQTGWLLKTADVRDVTLIIDNEMAAKAALRASQGRDPAPGCCYFRAWVILRQHLEGRLVDVVQVPSHGKREWWYTSSLLGRELIRWYNKQAD